MNRYAVALIGVVIALIIAACTDVSAPRQQGGDLGVLESKQVAEERPAPKAKKGVVPDVQFVALADAEKAIEKSGFAVGEKEPLATFGSESVASLVCEQEPAAGETPPKGTAVNLIFDRKC
jgi:hypothetical protein